MNRAQLIEELAGRIFELVETGEGWAAQGLLARLLKDVSVEEITHEMWGFPREEKLNMRERIYREE